MLSGSIFSSSFPEIVGSSKRLRFGWVFGEPSIAGKHAAMTAAWRNHFGICENRECRTTFSDSRVDSDSEGLSHTRNRVQIGDGDLNLACG